MAKTRYFCAATLDGYIADPDDGISWLTEFRSGYDGPGEPVLEAIDAYVEEVGALVMGSSTYEFLLDHSWPYGDRPTWVLTTRELPTVEGAVIRFHSGPVAEIHPQMAAAAGDRDLWVVGGGGIASDLLEAGLLDTLELTIVPIILGSGKRLFERPVPKPMRLVDTRTYSNGMTGLTYALVI